MRRGTRQRGSPAIPPQNPRRHELKRVFSIKHVGRSSSSDSEPMHEYDPSEQAENRRKRRSLFYDEQRAATKLSHPQHFDFDALTIPESPTTTTRSQKSSESGPAKKALAKLKNMFKA
ncbi:hypothetical protein M409DRAFT_27738 [Zasmidium cellare ATCC 36951]|uniref:Uncharacterized protein n=1 Tax=Zasmidium cellare ATCC 36951 TaxID=1080233 RepID=A0A6A6C514_ZASCE|nr:uncharacterized protein M409DRAFT_27738 [Zasmidium cellare ATCC 36951]KAF2162013.1 hypothetical protein M409DRAFT_27738 [Zasmidium cellare ATCC 36951]